MALNETKTSLHTVAICPISCAFVELGDRSTLFSHSHARNRCYRHSMAGRQAFLIMGAS